MTVNGNNTQEEKMEPIDVESGQDKTNENQSSKQSILSKPAGKAGAAGTAGIAILLIAVGSVCTSTNVCTSQDKDLQQLTERLFKIDQNNVFDKLHIDPKGPKFLSVKEGFTEADLFSGSTYAPLIALQDAYKPNVLEEEPNQENKIKTFLDAIMITEVMKETENFLKEKELITEKKGLREHIKHMWFGMFSKDKSKDGKDGIIGSSGFEHVFAAETMTKLTKAGNPGKEVVQGLHNWVYFFRKQKTDPPFYKQCNGKLSLGEKASILSLEFLWKNKLQKKSTMFIGTSPELEIAVYTTCFLARHNEPCNVKIAGIDIIIQAHPQITKNREATDILTSAYPSPTPDQINTC